MEQNCAQLLSSPQTFKTIYQVIFSHPELPACETNDGYRVHTMSYGELREKCERAGRAIHARLGAGHRYVGLAMENSPDWICAFWGILMSGNKPYLVNLRHPQSLTEKILRQLDIRCVIADAPGALEAEYLRLSDLEDGPSVPEDAFEDEIALSTSATSLKDVICFYRGDAMSAEILNVDHILKTNDRMPRGYHGQIKQLAFLPFYHIFGLVAVYLWFAFFNRTFVFLKDLSPDTLLMTCRKHQVTHIFAVPLLWHTIERRVNKAIAEKDEKTQKKFGRAMALSRRLQSLLPYAGPALAKRLMRQVTDEIFGPSVQFCISGGSYLRESALKLLNGIGYPLHNGYGMSEISITSVELDPRADKRDLNAIGKPFPSVEYRLSATGTLEVRGASLASRVVSEGVELPRGEWFDTGDMMEMDPSDGRWYVRGRRGDLVIGANGENINPDQLEQTLELPRARAFSVLGMPDEEGDEALSLVVQISPWLDQAGLSGLRDDIRRVNDALPQAQRLRRIYVTTDPIAPETAIKVGRQYLLRGIREGSIHIVPLEEMQRAGASLDGASPLAGQVTEIVARVLERDPSTIGYRDNLTLDLGVSSLQYFAILAELSRAFGLSDKGGEQTWCNTVEEFCQYIAREVD